MKKVLAFSVLATIALTSCMSEEQKMKEQAENEAMVNEKVNQIMEKLDQEATIPAQDTAVSMDSASIEEPSDSVDQDQP